MNAPATLTIAEHAADMVARGMLVFPVAGRSKQPISKGWQDSATADASTLPALFPRGVTSNFGIKTGNGIVVLDVDVSKGKRGDVALDELEIINGDLPQTLTVSTPSGGLHYYFRSPRPVGNSASRVGEGLDIRGDGGYVVGPGSQLQSGAYVITRDVPLADLPGWLLARCTVPVKRAPDATIPHPGVVPERAASRAAAYLLTAPASLEGAGGDDVAYRVACKAKDFGPTRDEAVSLMLEHWNPRCAPPWSVDEIRTKVDNAYGYGKERPGVAAPEAVFTAVEPALGALALPDYKRTDGGLIVAKLGNIKAALDRPDQCGARIAWDAFRAEIMLAPAGTNDWRPLVDTDYFNIRLRLEDIGFQKVTKDDLREVIHSIAEAQRFDSAIEWLAVLVWDGVPRVDSFFATCFGAEAGEYSTAVSRYWWSGLAGRVLAPPCQADMVPVLVGGQGIGKTQGCKAMAPAPEHFIEIDLGARDDDLARKMRGALVGEIGELRGLSSRDAESVKAWITRTDEHWVPKFKEFASRFPRRLMMIATSNQGAFLADETGERRWLPMRSAGVDVEAIKRDRDQLWAEGAHLFREHGVLWQDALRLATDQHEAFKIGDVWSEPIGRWLADFGEEMPSATGFSPRATWKRSSRPFRMSDLLQGALGISAAGQTKAVEQRAAKVLRMMGCADGRYYFEGVQSRGWKRIGPDDPAG